ncbi:hypothetical protein NDU88_000698 [Pleurodeles waltl]|uniref:Uncharacterized protein n=1 Tax=Pleurodeles waltl TaxID=8319 RepID=A0AAV7L7B2_PLEWA|nr:hypothetical protein NDU88_000698 [Pleurodeles waltl]
MWVLGSRGGTRRCWCQAAAARGGGHIAWEVRASRPRLARGAGREPTRWLIERVLRHPVDGSVACPSPAAGRVNYSLRPTQKERERRRNV